MQDRLRVLMQGAIRDKTAPGMTCAVSSPKDQFILHAGGQSYEEASPRITDGSLWDIASLTKVIGTFHCYERLIADGVISVGTELGEMLSCDEHSDKAALTIGDLLAHRAGFVGAIDYFETCETRKQVIESTLQTPLAWEPGTRRVYDDASYVLLGLALEQHFDCDLGAVFRRLVFDPMGMGRTLFNPPASIRQACVPTEWVPQLGQVAQGIVHDDNTRILGGIAGQAGLFSTARDLLRFGQGYLDWLEKNRSPLLHILPGKDGGVYTIGWDVLNPRTMPPEAGHDWLSHTGFTGTMLWISPKYQTVVVLLTNRVFPKRGTSDQINALRQSVLRQVIQTLSS